MKLFLMTVLMIFLAACTQAIPKESLNKVDPNLSFQMLIKDLNPTGEKISWWAVKFWR